MSLQSKKSPFPPLIMIVVLLSFSYWTYLGMTTAMDILYDSIEYAALGKMLQSKGLISYFTSGPNREPLYPLLIAASMSLEELLRLPYTRIMAGFGVILLLTTQLLAYWILRLLNVRTGICALVLAYMALSPALNNAAFSLYSEIAAIPLVVGILLVSIYTWKAIEQKNKKDTVIYGALLGFLLMTATMVKAVFECMTPCYIFIILMLAWWANKKNIITCLLCLFSILSLYYIPITAYKWLNQQHNGHFVITNRGSWALYGSTARRMEPLTPQRLLGALAYAPGEGVCNSLLGQQECTFWSFRQSDAFGYGKLGELQSQGMSSKEIDTFLIKSSAIKVLDNPLQYLFLTFVEGSKMFFWESTQIGFVQYPPWLKHIYNIKPFNNGLRLLMAILTILAVIALLGQMSRPVKYPISLMMLSLIMLYTTFFAFFFILTRYALLLAPLYLIAIGYWINQNLAPKKIN